MKGVFASYDIEYIYTVDTKGVWVWKWLPENQVVLDRYVGCKDNM